MTRAASEKYEREEGDIALMLPMDFPLSTINSHACPRLRDPEFISRGFQAANELSFKLSCFFWVTGLDSLTERHI